MKFKIEPQIEIGLSASGVNQTPKSKKVFGKCNTLHKNIACVISHTDIIFIKKTDLYSFKTSHNYLSSFRKSWVTQITDHLSDPTSPFSNPNSHSYTLKQPIKNEHPHPRHSIFYPNKGRAPGPTVSACDLTVWSLQHDLYPPGLESGKILLLKVPYGFLLKFILCS